MTGNLTGLALARDGAIADVASAEPLGAVDARDRRVGVGPRVGDGLAKRGDAEHATTVGEDAASVGLGSGVKDDDVLYLAGVFEAADDRALGVGAGITLGRHHHGQRGVGIPSQIDIL